MKTIFIGISLLLYFYSSQSLQVKEQNKVVPFVESISEEAVIYGPQLPDYYPNKISEYVRRIFQDSNGNLWFGTNSDGVARYDGKALSYLSVQQGLSGSQVTGILEDTNGTIWLSTTSGISRYSNKQFQNFTEKEGLPDASTWSLFMDSKGTIWAGTMQGLCRFNGTRFETFPVAGAKGSWIRAITEDRNGNLWIATANNGAFKIKGESVQRLSATDGLCSDDLTCILEDRKGNLWLGSMNGGVSLYDGKSFRNFTAKKEIGDNEVWNIYEDRDGTVWFGSEGYGVYCYKDGKLVQFGEKEGFPMKAVQSVYQDKQGRTWLGGGSGLYLYFGGSFTPVTKKGPWEEGC